MGANLTAAEAEWPTYVNVILIIEFQVLVTETRRILKNAHQCVDNCRVHRPSSAAYLTWICEI